jgi:hypothetical protein
MADANTQSSPIAEVQRESIRPGESDNLRLGGSTSGGRKQVEIVHSETQHHDRTLYLRAIWALAAQHFSRYGEDHLTLNKLTHVAAPGATDAQNSLCISISSFYSRTPCFLLQSLASSRPVTLTLSFNCTSSTIPSGVAILFSGAVGRMVDSNARLTFVRVCIVLQKCSSAAAYALFLVLFTRLRSHIHAEGHLGAVVWMIFAVIVLVGSLQKLATIGISVAVERDWVTVIADGNSHHLTRLNTYIRRIDLLSKLLAPLFVSLLTTVTSYPLSITILLGVVILSMVFEFLCPLS